MTLRRPAVDDMVVDTSAIVALLLSEASASAIAAALDASRSPIMSAASHTELGIVVAARVGSRGRQILDDVLGDAGIDVMPVDRLAAERAIDSWRRFGRGNHRAGLNFGDCFAHSLAEHTDLPLLCVGDDFMHTGIPLVALAE